jgi:hypothetical protein
MKMDNDEAKKHNKESKKHRKKKMIPSPKVSQSELMDCSYSEGCSSHSSDDSIKSNTIHSSEEIEEINSNNTTNSDNSTLMTKDRQSTSKTQCKIHKNKIIYSDENDIRCKSRSQLTKGLDSDNDNWKGITSKTKQSTKLHLAIISPTKCTSTKDKYNKLSPNYNKYDPKGTILNKNEKRTNNEDHSNDQQKVLKSGRKV